MNPGVAVLTYDNGTAASDAVITSIECALSAGAVNVVARWMSRCEGLPVRNDAGLWILRGPHRLAVSLVYPQIMDLFDQLTADQRQQMAHDIIDAASRGRSTHSSCVAWLIHHCARQLDGLADISPTVLAPWFVAAALQGVNDPEPVIDDLWRLDPDGGWAAGLLRHETVDLDVLTSIAHRVDPTSAAVDELPWQIPDGDDDTKLRYALNVVSLVLRRYGGHAPDGLAALGSAWTGTVGELLRAVELCNPGPGTIT